LKRLFILLSVLILISCNREPKKDITIYGWLSGPGNSTDSEIEAEFIDLKAKGLDGILYSGGHNPETYSRVGKIAKNVGLEFQAWVPAMVQSQDGLLDTLLYAVNGRGESAWSKPAYVGYYKFLCPNRSEVVDFLENLYGAIAEVHEVDGIHLDYIRFPDVILARGLWEKYGLVMDREYPQFDYCYCDSCVADFLELTGIDILEVDDPSTIDEWNQFRYDQITQIVAGLIEVARTNDKIITAAVFPGPNSIAKQIVRQEWDKWDLDAFFPMNYNDFYLEGVEWIGDVCKEAVISIDNRVPVYSGLFICPDPENRSSYSDPENHGLTPAELGEAIHISIKNGASGITLFTPRRMTPEGWEEFQKAISIY
jgi:hypothetical protein